jgi:hypothetical protein
MRIRNMMFLAAAIILLGLFPAAGAESYQFPSIYAGIVLPDGVYQKVLTPDNLQANEEFIKSKGGDVTTWAADFSAKGILLQAYDTQNDRALVITALKDVDGESIFDINEHPAQVRTKYRLSHGASGSYTILGYKYDSVSWRNFPGIGRFLQLRYTYRRGNEVLHRGYQRRTVRNGYTITVDMQVYGRQLSGRDNTALNKVFDTFTFSQILPMPPLPITLDETVSVPVETSKPSFTMKGKTKPEASLRAVLMSFSSGTTQVFEAKANKSGNYTLPIELPGEDVYVMTLTVSVPGFEDLNRSYNIRYQQGLLPAQIISAPGMELAADVFTLAGQTTESGVRATLYVNGLRSSMNVPKNGSFSFEIDTSAEGSYDIRLVLSKKGLQDRVFQYTAARLLSPQAREELLRRNALSPTYQELIANPDSYDDKMLRLEGTLVEKSNSSDTWVLHLALSKTENGFSDIVVLTADRDPGLAINAKACAYGKMSGMYLTQDEQGNEIKLPQINLNLLTQP